MYPLHLSHTLPLNIKHETVHKSVCICLFEIKIYINEHTYTWLYLQTHSFCFIQWVIIFILTLKLSQIWSTEAPSGLFLCCFNMCSSFLEKFLPLWYKMFQVNLVLFQPQPWNQPFVPENQGSYKEWCWVALFWALSVLVASCSVSHPRFFHWTELENKYMDMYTHIYISFHSALHLSMSLSRSIRG